MYSPSQVIRHTLPGIACGVLLVLASSTTMAETLSDPMQPPHASAFARSSKTVQHYYLSSILISPEHRSAIINGKRVGVGDRVDNARVTHIQGNEVTISVTGKLRTLTLLPLSIKKPAEASRQ